MSNRCPISGKFVARKNPRRSTVLSPTGEEVNFCCPSHKTRYLRENPGSAEMSTKQTQKQMLDVGLALVQTLAAAVESEARKIDTTDRYQVDLADAHVREAEGHAEDRLKYAYQHKRLTPSEIAFILRTMRNDAMEAVDVMGAHRAVSDAMHQAAEQLKTSRVGVVSPAVVASIIRRAEAEHEPPQSYEHAGYRSEREQRLAWRKRKAVKAIGWQYVGKRYDFEEDTDWRCLAPEPNRDYKCAHAWVSGPSEHAVETWYDELWARDKNNWVDFGKYPKPDPDEDLYPWLLVAKKHDFRALPGYFAPHSRQKVEAWLRGREPSRKSLERKLPRYFRTIPTAYDFSDRPLPKFISAAGGHHVKDEVELREVGRKHGWCFGSSHFSTHLEEIDSGRRNLYFMPSKKGLIAVYGFFGEPEGYWYSKKPVHTELGDFNIVEAKFPQNEQAIPHVLATATNYYRRKRNKRMKAEERRQKKITEMDAIADAEHRRTRRDRRKSRPGKSKRRSQRARWNPESEQHLKQLLLMRFMAGVADNYASADDIYVVGGAVRNYVLGQPIKDVDVVIDTVSLGKKYRKRRDSEWFAKALQRAIPVMTSLVTNQYGVAILTVKGDWMLGGVNLKGEVIEIANARKESYGGGAGKGYKPDAVVPATIQEDVLRREFTFNTLLWPLSELRGSLEQARIVDILGVGLPDLQQRVMRTPRDPDVVFEDDPTRMLRAVKFASKYGFRPDERTVRSIQRNAMALGNAPWEAVGTLFMEQVLGAPNPIAALRMTQQLGLLDAVQHMLRTQKGFHSFFARKIKDLPAPVAAEMYRLGLTDPSPFGFMDPADVPALLLILENVPSSEGSKLLTALRKPRVDNRYLIQTFNLPPRQRGAITPLARKMLLQRPSLADDPKALTEAVAQALSPSARSNPYARRNFRDTTGLTEGAFDSSGRYIPEKYLAGLSKKEREQRIKELGESRDEYGTGDWSELPSDRTARKKGLVKLSAYRKVAMERGFDISQVSDFKDMATKALKYYTGSAKAADVNKLAAGLEKVYGKGLAAWKSGGHRPGATARNWGDARVASVLVGGKAAWTADGKQFGMLPLVARKKVVQQLPQLYAALEAQSRYRDISYIKKAAKG